MYWTGVTNKLSYDKFAPCVVAGNSEYACGIAVGQSSYGEHGRWLNNSVNVVVHGLTTESGGYTGPLQYLINVTVKDNMMTIFIKKMKNSFTNYNYLIDEFF